MPNKQIKDAFIKVKEDISKLNERIDSIVLQIQELQPFFSQLKFPNSDKHPKEIKLTEPTDSKTEQQLKQTNTTAVPAYEKTPTDELPFEALKTPNFDISTGNRGVPTDRQTNQQTDRHIKKFAQTTNSDALNQISKFSEMLDSLDSLKKEVRSQFKKFTPQEFLVFATIYQLNEQSILPDYRTLALKTNLTESSIRDYTHKLIKKGAPLIKTKENNKKVSLQISSDFKRLVPLDTLITLRNL